MRQKLSEEAEVSSNMIGILVVTHGQMAEGMLDSLDMVMGSMEAVDFISLNRGEDYEIFEKNMENKIKTLQQGDGVLILADLFGASPFNAAQKAAKKLEAEGIQSKIISGANLAMLLEACSNRMMSNLEEVFEAVKASGKESIAEPVMVAEEGDDDY